jgi:hypothetical protein
MQVQWQTVGDPSAYVRSVLLEQAPDIPDALIVERPWLQEEIALAALAPDLEMIERHDSQARHIRRRDGFVAAVRGGAEIPPLIVLGKNHKLVDGYARYRALRFLGLDHGQVLRQS